MGDNRCSNMPPPLPPKARELRSHTFSVSAERPRQKSLPLQSRTAPDLSLWLPHRSASVQTLPIGDSERISEHPVGSSSECGSPIIYMGRKIQLRRKYATVSNHPCCQSLRWTRVPKVVPELNILPYLQ